MTMQRWYPARIMVIAIALVAMSWYPAHSEDSTQNFLLKTAPQLSRNAAILAGISTEMTSRIAALDKGSEERTVVEFVSDELNDVGFMLMLGGELLDGCQMIDIGYRKDYFRHLVVVLDRAVLQLSNKRNYLAGLKEKILDSRTTDDLSRAMGAIEKSIELLDQSAKTLDAQT